MLRRVCLVLFLCSFAYGDSTVGVPDVAAVRRSADRALQQGDYSTAAHLYERALSMTSGVRGSRAAEVVTCMNSLGFVYRELGRLDDARVMHTAALGIATLPGSDVDLQSSTFVALGVLETTAGRYADSERWLDRAERTFDSARTSRMEFARLLEARARLNLLLGRVQDAQRAGDRSWSIADRVLAPADEERIPFLDTRGSVFAALNRFSDAERAWTSAVEIATSDDLSASPRMIPIYSHLGELALHLAELEKAEQYLGRSLSILRRTGGAASVQAAAIMGEIAAIRTRAADFTRAKDMFDTAIALLDTPNAAHPLELAVLLTYYGEYFREQNRWEEAYVQFRRAAELRESALGEHPSVVAAYQLCATACKKLKRKDEARVYEQRASQLSERYPQSAIAANTVDLKSLKIDR